MARPAQICSEISRVKLQLSGLLKVAQGLGATRSPKFDENRCHRHCRVPRVGNDTQSVYILTTDPGCMRRRIASQASWLRRPTPNIGRTHSRGQLFTCLKQLVRSSPTFFNHISQSSSERAGSERLQDRNDVEGGRLLRYRYACYPLM